MSANSGSQGAGNGFLGLIGLTTTARGEGFSECQVEVALDLLNPHGTIHGGVIYSMADTGMGAAVYSLLEPGEICATIEITIAYFVAVRAGILTCRTDVINRAKRVVTLESQVRQGERLVAKAMGTFAVFAGERPAGGQG